MVAHRPSKRWAEKYGDIAGVRATFEQVMREWFEQQLVEAVLGGHSLRGSREWTVEARSCARARAGG